MKTHALGNNTFFFQIKPGLFAIIEIAINTATTRSSFTVLFSQFTSSSIMIMIMIMMMMMMTMIMRMIIIIIIIIMRKKINVSSYFRLRTLVKHYAMQMVAGKMAMYKK